MPFWNWKLIHWVAKWFLNYRPLQRWQSRFLNYPCKRAAPLTTSSKCCWSSEKFPRTYILFLETPEPHILDARHLPIAELVLNQHCGLESLGWHYVVVIRRQPVFGLFKMVQSDGWVKENNSRWHHQYHYHLKVRHALKNLASRYLPRLRWIS